MCKSVILKVKPIVVVLLAVVTGGDHSGERFVSSKWKGEGNDYNLCNWVGSHYNC